ncbi:MAG: hypothetical protein EYC69_10010 [Bacteroidetes bacterium]|nr:MAG: hypothetical protein EYC69_10010 [Bacteroidota bacterium]
MYRYYIILLLAISSTLNAQNVSFVYDNKNRLIEALLSDSTIYRYSYDANGNLKDKILVKGCKDLQEPNDSIPIALNLFSSELGNSGRDTSIKSYINSSYEQDWYRINNSRQSGRLSISLSKLPSNYNIELYDSSGICQQCYIAGSYEANQINENIIFNYNSSSTYNPPFYLKVYPSDGTQFSKCEPYELNIHWKPGYPVSIDAFIEGFYSGNNLMKSALDTSQSGIICDSVRLELRNTLSPFSISHVDTSTINIFGGCKFIFPLSTVGHSFYLVFRHRNTIETWSSTPITFDGEAAYYSFTDALNKSYGDNLIDLGDGNFGLISGDVNQDGTINEFDITELESLLQLFSVGYLQPDLTGDWIIEAADFSLIENNLGKFIHRP